MNEIEKSGPAGDVARLAMNYVTIVMRPYFELFGDRFSEREERRTKETKG
jgi:hypothetical protein